MNVSDLTPDALARLEAKLVADLEMVRRVRALLVEHQAVLGGVGAFQPAVGRAVAQGPAGAGAVVLRPEPESKPKPFEEAAQEALAQLPRTGFRTQDLRRKLTRQGVAPRNESLKNFLNRMIRRGKVQVESTRPGRGGSIYIHNLPPPGAEESPTVSGENSAGAGGEPVVSGQSPVVAVKNPPDDQGNPAGGGAILPGAAENPVIPS